MVKKSKEVKLPEFYFSHQVLWLRFTGIEVLKKDESLPYRIYSICTLLFCASFVLSEIIELQFHKDFDMVSVIAWYIIHHSLTIAKAIVIYRNRKEIGDLMRSFHGGFFKPDRKRGGEFEEECISTILGKSRFQTTQYGIFIILACSAGFVASANSRIVEKRENWVLPFAPMSLVDTTHSPMFEIMYCYQTLATCIICTWLYLCDSTVISIIAQTIAQLKILERSVRNYKQRSVEMQVDEKDTSTSNILHDTIKHHLDLLEAVDKVEYLCSYLVLCVFLSNLILLCLVMYYTSLSSVHSIEFARYVVYTIAIAAQVFLYCWWGNEMTLANDTLALGISQTYDPNDPVRYAKALQMMLVKAQKPLFFTAGKFVPLSIDTYKGIVKGSFSYFTMLRQVNSK